MYLMYVLVSFICHYTSDPYWTGCCDGSILVLCVVECLLDTYIATYLVLPDTMEQQHPPCQLVAKGLIYSISCCCCIFIFFCYDVACA
jgi:hypothetical protein